MIHQKNIVCNILQIGGGMKKEEEQPKNAIANYHTLPEPQKVNANHCAISDFFLAFWYTFTDWASAGFQCLDSEEKREAEVDKINAINDVDPVGVISSDIRAAYYQGQMERDAIIGGQSQDDLDTLLRKRDDIVTMARVVLGTILGLPLCLFCAVLACLSCITTICSDENSNEDDNRGSFSYA